MQSGMPAAVWPALTRSIGRKRGKKKEKWRVTYLLSVLTWTFSALCSHCHPLMVPSLSLQLLDFSYLGTMIGCAIEVGWVLTCCI